MRLVCASQLLVLVVFFAAFAFALPFFRLAFFAAFFTLFQLCLLCIALRLLLSKDLGEDIFEVFVFTFDLGEELGLAIYLTKFEFTRVHLHVLKSQLALLELFLVLLDRLLVELADHLRVLVVVHVHEDHCRQGGRVHVEVGEHLTLK